MRRLFSTFARGWPGTGLLLLRLVAGIALVVHGIEGFKIDMAIEGSLFAGAGVLLLAGLWTPVAGFLATVFVMWDMFARHGNPCSGVFLATIGAALALVGPGAWSMDAWLFGWKRLNI